MILLADSGSTKTDWCLTDGSTHRMLQTQGLNPCLMEIDTIVGILKEELCQQLAETNISGIVECRFYGAGCTDEKEPVMRSVLTEILHDFSNANLHVEVGSDLLGAAIALCGNEEGIACILGTGSNSCLFDGKTISQHTPALGYILGDEGGAAYIGKKLISDCLKGQLSEKICRIFLRETNLDVNTIINKVYRETIPNRFLGDVSKFCHQHLDNNEIRELVISCFCDFFNRNVRNYKRNDLDVNFVGAIAYHYENELREAGRRCGMKVGRILSAPIEGLKSVVVHK